MLGQADQSIVSSTTAENAPGAPELSAQPIKTELETETNSQVRRSPRDLVRWHGRRVGWCAVAGAVAGIAYLMTVGPTYTAQAKLHVPPPPQSSPISSITGISPLAVNAETYLNTQSQLVTSDAILNRVPEFVRDAKTSDLVNHLRRHLVVSVEHESDILNLSLPASSEREALDLLAGVTNVFVHHQGFERQSLSGDMIRTLREHQASLETEAERLQGVLNQFNRDNPNLSADASSALANNKLKQLTEQLTSIQMETLRAEQSFAADHPLRQQALAIETQVSNALKSAQDEVLATNAQLAEAREHEVALSRTRHEIQQTQKRIENLELQRDAEAARCGTTVIEPARIVHASIGASPFRAIGLFAIGGALFGAAWAVHREGNDRRLRCAEDVRRAIGDNVPVLGVVPMLPKRRTHIGKAMATHLDPRGAAAEAHRTIRSSMLVSKSARRTILVTSPNPGDGKSCCATNLCIALAQAGKSVVLVDADLRRPTQHVNLDLHDGAGICEAMESIAALRWAIQPTGIDNFHALIAGQAKRNPSEVLGSSQFHAMLGELLRRYNHVVIDSPPVNVVNDAQLIGGLCDATVMVVRAEATTDEDVARAMQSLQSAGAQLAGVVVNAAPVGENFGVYTGAYFARVDSALQNARAKPSATGTHGVRDERATWNVSTELQTV